VRLVELKPHWIGLNGWAAPEPFYIGLSFLCPHCPADLPEHGQTRRRRLAVSFWPPIDPGNWAKRFAVPFVPTSAAHRRISGETFDTLTLEPSIGFESIGHWHGRITNGAIAL
jgi:hypothetical protein